MAIRDADMYGRNWSDGTNRIGDILSSLGLPFHWIQVSGNRGASGIDGLLSTAIGFAVGCNKRVSANHIHIDIFTPVIFNLVSLQQL